MKTYYLTLQNPNTMNTQRQRVTTSDIFATVAEAIRQGWRVLDVQPHVLPY